MRHLLTMAGLLLVLDASGADAVPKVTRHVPPAGIAIAASDRDELLAGAKALAKRSRRCEWS